MTLEEVVVAKLQQLPENARQQLLTLIDTWIEQHRAADISDIQRVLAAVQSTWATVTLDIVQASAEVRKRDGLLTNDSFVVACMRQQGLTQLATANGDFDRVGGLTEAVLNEYPKERQPSHELITQTLWSLIGKGFYINMWQPAPENWEWRLTDAGTAAAKDEQFNPDDPELYMARLHANIPAMSDLVAIYANEAVRCYTHERYLASAVMLGVASEAAFMEMATSSVTWLQTAGG